jgi:hypothetical protein
VSITLVLAVVVTIATGIGFSLGVLMSLGPLTTMQVHVASGVFAVVLGMAHVLKRPQPILAPDLRRRALLRLAVVGGLAAVAPERHLDVAFLLTRDAQPISVCGPRS